MPPALPAAMQPPNAFANPDPNAGGGPIAPYSGISYAADELGLNPNRSRFRDSVRGRHVASSRQPA